VPTPHQGGTLHQSLSAPSALGSYKRHAIGGQTSSLMSCLREAPNDLD
jgi:hypothetical protein